MFKSFVAGLAAVGAFALAQPAAAQQDFSKVQIKAEQIAPGIHVLFGAGGNIGLSSGEDGTFMIDDQFAPLTEKIVAAVKSITDKPVEFVVNTHWHFDHTGGNANLGKMGARFVAHENVRKLMSTAQTLKAFNMTVDPAPKEALPFVTFADGATFHLNGQTIQIKHVPNAHTNGDAFVHFVEADVIHAGDVFFNGFYPFIDVEHGGGIQGMIDADNAILAVAGPNTKIIPGHGPMGDKASLTAFRDMLIGVRDSVMAAMEGGKSLEQVVAAKPTASVDEKWGKGFLPPDRFTSIVYASLKK